MSKIKGFNNKEQRIFDHMKDGQPYNFRQLKVLFWKEAEAYCAKIYKPGWGKPEVDSQAQSFARNSIRRLIRDGWVEQSGRGTYRLTKTGKIRVAKGTDVTPSALTHRRGRPLGGTTVVPRIRFPKAAKERTAPAPKTKKSVAKKADPKKVKAIAAKVAKEATTERLTAKAKQTAAKADKETGHKKKIKDITTRVGLTIEEKLAAMLG